MNPLLDIIVIVVFSAFILGIGLLFSRTGVNMKSFFAGGEAVPWFIGGLSLFMSFFSAGTFVAWGSIAYQYGWVSVTIQWTMAFGALFSKRLSGKATIVITITTLLINLFFKMILPVINGFKLDRAEEMVVGVGVPTLFLLLFELYQKNRIGESSDYTKYMAAAAIRKANRTQLRADKDEIMFTKKQNHFGLKIIAFSLLITAVILFALSVFTPVGREITGIIGAGILLTAIIPWVSSLKIKKEIKVLEIR